MVLEVLSNRWLWFYGLIKCLKDVAVFGMIFWAPTLIQAILNGQALDLNRAMPHHHHGSGEACNFATVTRGWTFGGRLPKHKQGIKFSYKLSRTRSILGLKSVLLLLIPHFCCA